MSGSVLSLHPSPCPRTPQGHAAAVEVRSLAVVARLRVMVHPLALLEVESCRRFLRTRVGWDRVCRWWLRVTPASGWGSQEGLRRQHVHRSAGRRPLRARHDPPTLANSSLGRRIVLRGREPRGVPRDRSVTPRASPLLSTQVSAGHRTTAIAATGSGPRPVPGIGGSGRRRRPSGPWPERQLVCTAGATTRSWRRELSGGMERRRTTRRTQHSLRLATSSRTATGDECSKARGLTLIVQ